MKKIVSLLAVSLFLTVIVFGDVRLPDTPKPTPKTKQKDATMRITIDNNATEAVLKLNKSSLKQLIATLEDIDREETEPDATAAVKGLSSPQTVIGGIFLSLGFVFGGVWIFRAKPSKTVAGLFLIGCIITATTFVFANIAPPLAVRKITNKTFSEEVNGFGTAVGNIKIEIGNKNSMSKDVELIVPMSEGNKPKNEE